MFYTIEEYKKYINGLLKFCSTKHTILKIEIFLNNEIIETIKPIIYYIRLYRETYSFGKKTINEYNKSFNTLENCYNYINGLPKIGTIIKECKKVFNYSEYTILKIEILLDNKIIKEITNINNQKNLDSYYINNHT
jgi:hypothetical protein